jgi:hypothetical protein
VVISQAVITKLLLESGTWFD